MDTATALRGQLQAMHTQTEQVLTGLSPEVLNKVLPGANIGAISGIVGLAGGLGGFVLPIMFGALMDLTGIRSSAFMLMYGVVWVSLIWMYFTEVRKTEVMGEHAPAAPSFTH